MSKKLRLILLSVALVATTVFAVVRAATPEEPLLLSAQGCQNVAQAMGYGSLKQQEGDPSPWIVLKEPDALPAPFITHIRLLNHVLRQFAHVDPQSHYEDYLKFCYEAQGDIEEMNMWLKRLIKETDV